MGRREESALRKDDVKMSDEIYSFLDRTFYANETANFERVTDKARQVSGIDVIFDIDGNHYTADEKAAVRYRNLKTYTLELSFINRNGEVQNGWFINDNLKNNSYVFVWVDKDETTGKESVTVAVIMKSAIHKYLEEKGWTKENLARKEELIRSGAYTYMGNLHTDGCRFIFSQQLVEQPINIQLSRDVYMKLADKVWTEDLD